MLIPPRLFVAITGPPLLPTIASFTLTTTVFPLCGTNWRTEFAWTIANPNNAGYYLRLINTSTGLPFFGTGNLDCADGSFEVVGNTGDPLFTGFVQTVNGRLEVFRRSDDALLETSATLTDSVDTGAPC